MQRNTSMLDENVFLVSSSGFDEFGRIPFGTVILASDLEKRFGVDVKICDLPVGKGSPSGSISELARRIANSINNKTLFVGFSTMCDSMVRSLSVARELKRLTREVPIVFGGPEASINAQQLLSVYKFIDCILIGEAEGILDELVDYARTGKKQKVSGLVYNHLGEGEGVTDYSFSKIINVDDTTLPNYSLYPNPSKRFTPVEVGRGCPFSCRFCATSTFFQRAFRMKSPEKIIENINAILSESRPEGIDFVHDSFTVNERVVKEICQSIVREHKEISWSCSSRTDTVSKELLGTMFQSGCDRIFFGLETGSQRLQKVINKNLNLNDTYQKIKFATELGIKVVVSMIIGFPEENEEDLAQTIEMAFRLRALGEGVKSAQIHLLSPLAGTNYSEEYLAEAKLDWFVSDIAPLKHFTEWEKEQISGNKELFQAYYYFDNASVERRVYKYVYWFLFYSEKFSLFFKLLYKIKGPEVASAVIQFAKSKEKSFFDDKHLIDYDSLISVMQVELGAFVKQYFTGDDDKLLREVLMFEVWKVVSARSSEAVPHISSLNFLSDNEIRGDIGTQETYIYSFDASRSKVRSLRVPSSLVDYLPDMASI